MKLKYINCRLCNQRLIVQVTCSDCLHYKPVLGPGPDCGKGYDMPRPFERKWCCGEFRCHPKSKPDLVPWWRAILWKRYFR